MSVLRGILVFLASCLLAGQAQAQIGSNFRSRQFAIQGDTLVLDSSSVIPKSLLVQGVSAIDYRLDPVNAWLIWLKNRLQTVYIFPGAALATGLIPVYSG